MLGQYFDPDHEVHVTQGRLPHWAQAGAVVFVTFRTHDSIPRAVIERWEQEKQSWVARRGWSGGRPWREVLPLLDEASRRDFNRHFNRCREELLDDCLGASVLRSPDAAQIVADTLLHFDGVRYRMGDFVVMPNHVHLLCAFDDPTMMRKQFDSWLHYSARLLNQRLGRCGRFWQGEPFDHLVRSPEQFDYLCRYVRENPAKARLPEGEFLYRRTK